MSLEIVYAVREEMACTLRDVLARRFRLEVLDWAATQAAIPLVADLMAEELGWSEAEKAQQVADYEALLGHFLAEAGLVQ